MHRAKSAPIGPLPNDSRQTRRFHRRLRSSLLLVRGRAPLAVAIHLLELKKLPPLLPRSVLLFRESIVLAV